MTRYFFHVHDAAGVASDEEGRELVDHSQAERVALEGARSLICADVKAGVLDLSGCIHVADESGAVVLVVAFVDAVEVRA